MPLRTSEDSKQTCNRSIPDLDCQKSPCTITIPIFLLPRVTPRSNVLGGPVGPLHGIIRFFNTRSPEVIHARLTEESEDLLSLGLRVHTHRPINNVSKCTNSDLSTLTSGPGTRTTAAPRAMSESLPRSPSWGSAHVTWVLVVMVIQRVVTRKTLGSALPDT